MERPGLAHVGILCLAGVLMAFALSAVAGSWRAAQASAIRSEWEPLRAGGMVVLIRHALAPGTGDPLGFVLEDCATQRNLSDEGRAQAARLGEAFQANRVAVGRVLSSGWCRCVETAALAFGAVEVWPPLHSFFADHGTAPSQTTETRAAVATWTGPGTLVMVTHQVNITALTGIVPGSGEVILLMPAPDRPAGFTIVAQIAID
jgi:phosphohistidine phosphatase SixA